MLSRGLLGARGYFVVSVSGKERTTLVAAASHFRSHFSGQKAQKANRLRPLV